MSDSNEWHVQVRVEGFPTISESIFEKQSNANAYLGSLATAAKENFPITLQFGYVSWTVMGSKIQGWNCSALDTALYKPTEPARDRDDHE